LQVAASNILLGINSLLLKLLFSDSYGVVVVVVVVAVAVAVTVVVVVVVVVVAAVYVFGSFVGYCSITYVLEFFLRAGFCYFLIDQCSLFVVGFIINQCTECFSLLFPFMHY
jgi:hypothetical protein